MSILLDDASLQYAERAEAIGLSFPFAIACRFYLDDDAIDQTLVSIANSLSEDSFYALSLRGVDSAAFGQVRASIVDDLGKIEQADSVVGATAGAWHHALGIWVAADDVRVYLNGIDEGLSPGISGATAPTGMDTTSIGRLGKLTPQQYISGRVAEVSIWNLSTQFTVEEINDLGVDLKYALMCRSDELSFYAPMNNADDPVVDIIARRNLTLFNGPVVADHPPVQYYEPETFGRFRSGPLQFDIPVATPFGFSHQANWALIKPASNSIGFQQQVQHNVIVVHVQHNLSFGQSIQKNQTLNVAVEHALSFGQKHGPTTEESLSNSIAFSQLAARAGDPSNDVLFDQIVAAEKSTGVKNGILFDQIVAALLDLNIPLNNGILFGQTVVAWKDEPCDRHEYNPQGAGMPAVVFGDNDTISLVCGADSIVLRNPSFGNAESLDVDRALNVSRGGKPNIVRDPNWPESTTITIEITTLKAAEAQALLDFMLACLGQLVTYTDYENRVWEGVILNPGEAVIEQREDVWSANIELIGNPV